MAESRRLAHDEDPPNPKVELPDGKRPDAPPSSRLGRLGRLAALSTRALPMATEAVRRAAFGKRKDPEAEAEAEKRVLENGRKTAEAMLKATIKPPPGVAAKDLRFVAFVQEHGSRKILGTTTRDAR